MKLLSELSLLELVAGKYSFSRDGHVLALCPALAHRRQHCALLRILLPPLSLIGPPCRLKKQGDVACFLSFFACERPGWVFAGANAAVNKKNLIATLRKVQLGRCIMFPIDQKSRLEHTISKYQCIKLFHGCSVKSVCRLSTKLSILHLEASCNTSL
jgi:hypothetical protein